MLETGIGRGRARRAGRTARLHPATGDVAGSAHYFGPDNDPQPRTSSCATARSRCRLGPGLGIDVRPEQLVRYTIARERLSAKDE